MKRILALIAVVAALPVAAESAPDPAMSAAQFLVGTWHCAHTVGDFSGIYTTTYANALGNMWLRQTYDFPATATEPAIRAEYFIRYDAGFRHWVRFGAHSNGMYFGMVGEGTPDRWSWTYVLPGRSEPGATVYTKKSDSEYAIDGPTYPQNGKMVTEHHTCKKAS